MRDTVLYVGGFGLPSRTASALRALGNATVLRKAGYRVVIAGKFSTIPDPALQPVQVEGFACHDIRQPLPGLAKVDYTVSPKNIRHLLAAIGPDRVAAVMAYNYPGWGLSRLIAACKSLGVAVINESTEWYGREGLNPISNIRRMLESRWRNNGLAKNAANFICATQWSRHRHPELNALVLPFALDPAWEVWQGEADASWCDKADVVRLVYSGSPGIGMHKDRLPILAEALARVADAGADFRFAVVGMTQAEYLASAPRHRPLLERHQHRIRFLGKKPHADAVRILKSADFSVFVRKRNRVSEVGFPTKYAEAATCGIPVLTNRSSDIADYLKDGENGLLLPDCSVASIQQGLARALRMSRQELDAMRARAAGCNPFAIDAWVEPMRQFMQALRHPR